MSEIDAMLDRAYESMEGSEAAQRYSERHGIESAAILTVTDDERAAMVAEYLRPQIEGRVVVEIGAGIGLLAFYMAEYARGVIAIEASPVWTSVYVAMLHTRKPANVTFIFGAAEQVAGMFRADVALFCTHSGREAMRAVAARFAPKVIDVYCDLLGEERIARAWEAAEQEARAAAPTPPPGAPK